MKYCFIENDMKHMKKDYLIELCLEDVAHAIRAEQLGANRIELCANLIEGGTTPSYGMIKSCVDHVEIPVHVMLRCRAGNFDYTPHELDIMLHDAEAAAGLGARGVVFGFLKPDLSLDVKKTEKMVQKCHGLGLKMTFHRAIDVCQNPMDAAKIIAGLGVENLLTSGAALTAPKGLGLIKAYVEEIGDQINILAGCGINSRNVRQIVEAGVRDIHFTSHHYVAEKINVDFEFGSHAVFDDQYTIDIIHELRA
jgi:copper homeostasis protein